MGTGIRLFYLTCGVCDYAAALLSAYGVCAALYARRRAGKGQRIETSLSQASIAVQSGSFIFYKGRPDLENGGPDLWGTSDLYRIYLTANNSLFLAVLEDPHWQALCSAIRRTDLSDRYSFHQACRESVESPLGEILAEIFASKTTEEWVSLLDTVGVPCAPILPLPQLFSDEHVVANDLIATHTHPQWGEVRQTGIFAKFSPHRRNRSLCSPTPGTAHRGGVARGGRIRSGENSNAAERWCHQTGAVEESMISNNITPATKDNIRSLDTPLIAFLSHPGLLNLLLGFITPQTGFAPGTGWR